MDWFLSSITFLHSILNYWKLSWSKVKGCHWNSFFCSFWELLRTYIEQILLTAVFMGIEIWIWAFLLSFIIFWNIIGTLMACGMDQCVNSCMHVNSNKLDLVFAEAGSDLTVSSYTKGIFILDHKLAIATLNIRNAEIAKKLVTYEKEGKCHVQYLSTRAKKCKTELWWFARQHGQESWYQT